MPKLDHIVLRPNIRAILNILPLSTISKFFKQQFSLKKPESLLYLAIVFMFLFFVYITL